MLEMPAGIDVGAKIVSDYYVGVLLIGDCESVRGQLQGSEISICFAVYVE